MKARTVSESLTVAGDWRGDTVHAVLMVGLTLRRQLSVQLDLEVRRTHMDRYRKMNLALLHWDLAKSATKDSVSVLFSLVRVFDYYDVLDAPPA